MIRTRFFITLGLLLGLFTVVAEGAANPPILATVFLGVTAIEAGPDPALAAPSSKAPTDRTARLKEKLLGVPTGAMIEVQLLNKERVRGRLGQIDDQGFSLTTAERGKIVTRNIVFTEVNSIRQAEGGKTGHRLIWMMAGVGVFFVIMAVVAVSQL